MTTVAETLVQTIRAAGVDTVFGLPGGENAEVLDAIRQEGLEFILVRNESSAVFMADAAARLTGKIGVALTTLGPGAANAYSGIAHAYLDRAPVLLMTAQSDSRILDRHTHQVLDLQASFKPVTKMTVELTQVGTRQVVEEAIRLTMDGRPGPVHLGISSFMARQEVIDESVETDLKVEVEQASPPETSAAQAFLGEVRRPVILAGLGLEPEKPYEQIRRLAEALQAPVIVTPKAKGALADVHPLSAGTIGLTQNDPAYAIINDADCIVAIGFDAVELVRIWDHDQPLIWIAPWANEDPQLPTVKYELVGLMRPILERLAQANYDPQPGWGASRVAAFRKAHALDRMPLPAPGRLSPQTVLNCLRQHIPRDAVVTTDVGSHKIFSALNWPTFTPNSYLVSNGLSAMGSGLPAAIAAARVTKERTVCISGDGGMAMVMGELGLLSELDLPVIVVVMNDNALDLIRSAQIRSGKPVFGTEFSNPDYAKIALAFDLGFFRVSNQEACAEAMRWAAATYRPTLIEALIDPAGYPTTPPLD